MRFAALIASAALLVCAPAFAQTAPESEPAAAAAPEAPAAQPEAPEAAPDANEVVCREVQRVGSRLRSQRDRYCATRAQWDREDADLRNQFNRANSQGNAGPSPSGRGAL